MSFDDFTFVIDNLSKRLNNNTKKLGFKVKLSDGEIIEFYPNTTCNWEKLFIIERDTYYTPPKNRGLLSVCVGDSDNDNISNLYVVPCENIDYIQVTIKDKVDDSKKHLISW